KALGNGKPLPTKTLDNGRRLHRWYQKAPVPPFTYGFAAGPYVEASKHAGGVTLHYYGAGFSKPELETIFTDTGDMIRFFSHRAGIPYAGEYSQVLVPRTVGQ